MLDGEGRNDGARQERSRRIKQDPLPHFSTSSRPSTTALFPSLAHHLTASLCYSTFSPHYYHHLRTLHNVSKERPFKGSSKEPFKRCSTQPARQKAELSFERSSKEPDKRKGSCTGDSKWWVASAIKWQVTDAGNFQRSAKWQLASTGFFKPQVTSSGFIKPQTKQSVKLPVISTRTGNDRALRALLQSSNR